MTLLHSSCTISTRESYVCVPMCGVSETFSSSKSSGEGTSFC